MWLDAGLAKPSGVRLNRRGAPPFSARPTWVKGLFTNASGSLIALRPRLRSALAPRLVRCPDLLGERPVAIEGGVLVDRHRGLRRVAGPGLELGGGGAVLAGEGQGGVAQVVDGEIRSTGGLAGGAVAV